MWKIGVFLIVISIGVLAGEARATGYCTGIGLNCIPVMYGHLLGVVANKPVDSSANAPLDSSANAPLEG